MTTQFHKLPAHALLNGDQVGSGETIVSVSACEHFDPLWPQLFGWLPGKEVKRQP